MSFFVTHIDGSMEQPEDFLGSMALLDELSEATAEHGDIAVGHESGWVLTVLAGGRVVWENVEEDSPSKNLDGLTRAETLELMMLVANGDIDAIESRLETHGPGS